MKYSLMINILNDNEANLLAIKDTLGYGEVGRLSDEEGYSLNGDHLFATEEERNAVEASIESLEGVLNGSNVGSTIKLVENHHDDEPITPCDVTTLYEVIE